MSNAAFEFVALNTHRNTGHLRREIGGSSSAFDQIRADAHGAGGDNI